MGFCDKVNKALGFYPPKQRVYLLHTAIIRSVQEVEKVLCFPKCYGIIPHRVKWMNFASKINLYSLRRRADNAGQGRGYCLWCLCAPIYECVVYT